jgi:autotransporter-associated beta strand protein
MIFDAGATNYTITVDSDNDLGALIISGPGISNNSGKLQNFVGQGDEGNIDFQGTATAGTLTQFTMQGGDGFDAIGGEVRFFDHSSADQAAFIINGAGQGNAFPAEADFFKNSTAANATFSVKAATKDTRSPGEINFFDTSTAGNAVMTMEGATLTDAYGGSLFFSDNATADNATCVANGGSAAGALGGTIAFSDDTTAGQATLMAKGGSNGGAGGSIFLGQGAEARVEVFGNGNLNIGAATTIGSLEGDGIVFLGTNQLTVGTNNLSTAFSGVIQNAGTLTKSGTGTLTLSGANTYTGGTTVLGGTLKVSNTAGSGTGTGAVSVQAGSLAGRGIISGAITVGTGSGAGASLAPGKGASKPTTLILQGALTFKADGSYAYKLNTKKAKGDQVVANGVAIESGANFDLTGVGNKKLTAGKVFTALTNTAASPISGTFANLADGSTVTVGVNKLQVSYSGGDGNDLTLTVVP